LDPTLTVPSAAEPDPGYDRVHADLTRYFPELVRELGGDPEALMRRLGLEPAAWAQGGQPLGYRAWAGLLEEAARELACPDLGLRLAARQGGGSVFGPMGVVMRNSKTFGEALQYVISHNHAHSLAAQIRLEPDPDGFLFVAHEILVERLPNKAQALEQIMLLGHLNAIESTGGRARVREVRFRHQPLSPLRTYRRHFGCPVLFDQQEDGTVYSERDLASPILDADARAYAAATSLIEAEFPPMAPPLRALVRGAILQRLGAEDCSNEAIAAKLGLHSRTLHRRLRAEGASFQAIKDEVRRDVALYYVQHTGLDLADVAQKLGYSEHSVFTRSCLRWFSAPPSELRAQRARAG
jgi:AraC-like DNA-binding protein